MRLRAKTLKNARENVYLCTAQISASSSSPPSKEGARAKWFVTLSTSPSSSLCSRADVFGKTSKQGNPKLKFLLVLDGFRRHLLSISACCDVCCEVKKKHLRYLVCVASTGRSVLVFCIVLRKYVGKSNVVGYCDCRHVCDGEVSYREDLDESDHVHDDHDDHCSASGSVACLVMFPLFHCTSCLCSRCSSVYTVLLPPP